MELDLKFDKALRLLDLNRQEQATVLLHEVITQSRESGNTLLYIRANCVMGELLTLENRLDEARPYLHEVLATSYEDDAADYEKSIAKELLTQPGT